MIENTQDLLTHLTTMDATAERRFPVSADNVRERTGKMRTMVGLGATLPTLRARAIELKAHPFQGSGAGMKWLDAAWERLVEAFPVPVEEAEIAAHLTADLMEANR